MSIATFAAFIAVCASLPTVAGAATLAEKKAQAARLNAEVGKLDSDYDHLQERYRGAMYRLDELRDHVGRLTIDLRHTEANLAVAQQRLTDRAVAVYENGAANSRLVNLAQAGSFSRFVDRMEAIQRLGEQDARILHRIKVLRQRVADRREQLKDAEEEQQQLVKDARHDRDLMARKLEARRAILASVNAEVRQMAEAQRRAELAAAQARARAQARTVTVRTDDEGGAVPSSTTDIGEAIGGGAPAPPASGNAASAASVAMQYLGVPYVWGGSTPSGFDCSGLVMYAFAQVGISLPHSSYALWNAGVHVSRSELQTGDLVFFSGLGHVGIYVGGGSFVHAPRTGDVVKVSSMNDSYGINNYVGAVRITG